MEPYYSISDDCLLLTLTEELDQHFTERIRDEIDKIIINCRIRYIIFDFKNQSFMDSSGIGFIMGRYKRIALYGGRIYVVNLGRSLERIFNISGLHKITAVQDSVDKALLEIKRRKEA